MHVLFIYGIHAKCHIHLKIFSTRVIDLKNWRELRNISIPWSLKFGKRKNDFFFVILYLGKHFSSLYLFRFFFKGWLWENKPRFLKTAFELGCDKLRPSYNTCMLLKVKCWNMCEIYISCFNSMNFSRTSKRRNSLKPLPLWN